MRLGYPGAQSVIALGSPLALSRRLIISVIVVSASLVVIDANIMGAAAASSPVTWSSPILADRQPGGFSTRQHNQWGVLPDNGPLCGCRRVWFRIDQLYVVHQV